MVYEKDFICTYHRKILNNTKKIIKKIKELDASEQIVELLNEIIQSAKLATKAGKHMEGRLYEYYNAIEALGFERKKKKR